MSLPAILSQAKRKAQLDQDSTMLEARLAQCPSDLCEASSSCLTDLHDILRLW
jgi:hypothetical protein